MSEDKQSEQRFSALINGAGSKGAKVLRVPADCSLEDLCAAASETLGDGPFTNVFLKSGAEIGSRTDLRDDDVLVFAKESEGFKQAEGLLQSLANYTLGVSSDLYASYVPRVVEAFPAVARPIAKVEELAGVMQPRVVEYGVPALQWADKKLMPWVDRMQGEKDRFLQSELGQKTSEVLVGRYQQGEHFFKTAMSSWENLDKNKLSLTEFIKDVKEKMGSAWSERLMGPAQAFYAAAVDESKAMLEKKEGESQVGALIHNIQTRLGPTWEKSVSLAQEKGSEMLPSRIKNPAGAFYQAAVESFVSLHLTAQQGQVSVQEFIAGMRVKLGGLWSQGLSPITAQLFELLQQMQQKKGEVSPEVGGDGESGEGGEEEKVAVEVQE